VINLAEITNLLQHALDHALTLEQLGHYAVHGVDAVEGYIERGISYHCPIMFFVYKENYGLPFCILKC